MAAPDLAILGTLTRDTTVYADGSRSENLGGLFYTIATLAHLFDGAARLRVVAHIGADFDATARATLAGWGVDASCLRTVAAPNNHVFLTYRDADQRDEILHGLVPPVDLELLSGVVDADALLVNLTSGRDVGLEALQGFRRRFPGIIQLDIHSLTLDFTAEGRRVLRLPADWEAWVRCADWVQMNETEARLLGGGVPPLQFARRVLGLGPQGVLVTLGARGCVAAWRDGEVVRDLIVPAPFEPQPAYPTGCGDVFGAAFAYARLSGAAVRPAIELATAVATTKAAHEPQAALARIRELTALHLQRCFG
jgi:sugar/nucleoside kinase (ribokinase family)